MKTFKEWLTQNEVRAGSGGSWRGTGMLSTTRGPGTRQHLTNPVVRAGLNTTPFHVQAVTSMGNAFSDLKNQSMYPGSAGVSPPTGAYGNMGYEGTESIGPKRTHKIGTIAATKAGVELTPEFAIYEAIRRMILDCKKQGAMDKFDWDRAYVNPPQATRTRASGAIYYVSTVVPWKNSPKFNLETNQVPFEKALQIARTKLGTIIPDLKTLLR